MYLISHMTTSSRGCTNLWVVAPCYMSPSDKSCDHKHSNSGYMFLICHLTSRQHTFKGLY